VSFEPGSDDCDEIMLAFTGVRHALAGIDKEDFVNTNRTSRLKRDAYYINDLARSWYNEIRQEVIDVLQPRIRGRRVVTLGNSLGGFGALMFSGLFETCDVALAFVPQYSIKPKLVPFEDRWDEFKTNINAFEHDTCFLPGIDYTHCCKYVFCGEVDARDLAHAKLIAKSAKANTHVFLIVGCGHDLSFKLRERKLLRRLVDIATSKGENAASIQQFLVSAGVDCHTVGCGKGMY
jgi:hypothetical protein